MARLTVLVKPMWRFGGSLYTQPYLDAADQPVALRETIVLEDTPALRGSVWAMWTRDLHFYDR